MKLGELIWKEYTKGVSRRILRLVRRIIEKRREGLEKFLESSEFGALGKSSQIKFQEELADLFKILEMLEGSLASGTPSSLDISELGPESESKIKGAISEAARRLRPMDQKGILEALQSKKEAKSPSEMSEEKIDELLHSGEAHDKILEILSLLHYEIHKFRISAEAIPRELRELRMLFARIERQGGFK
ncbi:hypothetical protein ES703_119356 [subsurface metagenome]